MRDETNLVDFAGGNTEVHGTPFIRYPTFPAGGIVVRPGPVGQKELQMVLRGRDNLTLIFAPINVNIVYKLVSSSTALIALCFMERYAPSCGRPAASSQHWLFGPSPRHHDEPGSRCCEGLLHINGIEAQLSCQKLLQYKL
jgi:hypothetical protein